MIFIASVALWPSLNLKSISFHIRDSSFTLLSNHTWRKAKRKVSAHYLPLYYQPQSVLSMAWTDSVQWNTCWKWTHTKLLQIFWTQNSIYYTYLNLVQLHSENLSYYIGLVVECSLMGRENGVQSQVGSYQRLKKQYLIAPCITLSIIRYISRVKWSNLGISVVLSPTTQCSSYWKGSLWVTLDYGCQLYLHCK